MKIEVASHEMICGGQKQKERGNRSSTNNSSRNESRGAKRKKWMNVTHTVKISGQTSDSEEKESVSFSEGRTSGAITRLFVMCPVALGAS